MKKIILTKGLPASGKTTWAKQLMEEHPGRYKRVNKDDLRAMMDGGKWSRDNEKFVLHMRDYLVEEALEAGKHVIVDDTNLHSKHKNQMWKIAAAHNATVEIKDFTDVAPEVCIERDLRRPRSVGAKVIWKMFNQFLKPKQELVEIKHDPELPTAILCDIDGTIALMHGRSPYDMSMVDTDKPNNAVIEIVQTLRVNRGYKLILVSGRSSDAREKTQQWLIQHMPDYDGLFMREEGDTRKDVYIKKEIYEREIHGKYNVFTVFDDRNQTVQGWRDLGLTCLQVNNGDF